MEAATAHTHTHAYVYPLVLANFSPARSFGLCCRLFVAAVELKALACYTLWNQLQSCHAPWTLTPCHAPHTTPFEAQVFMFVLARRRLIKSLASELPGPPGPPHFLSKVTSSPANVIFPFTFLPKKKREKNPLPSFWHVSAINFNWKLCVIILNFYCLTHEMETLQQFPKETPRLSTCKLFTWHVGK